MKKKLLVMISDRLSDLVKKGEITPRYYNPGNLFDEVHILMTNDDRVNPNHLQKTVGRAKLQIYSLGNISFKKTLGWQPFLLKSWSKKVVELAGEIQPKLIHTHGNSLNGYFAAQVRKELGVPLVVSLHTHPDENRKRMCHWSDWKSRFIAEWRKSLENVTLRTANCVIPVYESIRGYAKKYGAKRINVIYNIINPIHLGEKMSYEIHTPPKIISLGRQIDGKNPDNLIRAVAKTDAELTLVGNGELHDYLKKVAHKCGISNRVHFKLSVPNDKLCQILPDYDIFAVHCDYWGVPKTVLEALLTGLPVVINRRYPELVPELEGWQVMLVENTKEGYLNALQKLIGDDKLREELGRKGCTYAWEHFAPDKMEQRVVDLYRELVPGL